MKVAYQGEPGAYSDEAVSAVFPDAQAVGFATFRLTFDALAMGAVDAAVLPVENSSAGVVQEVSDLLWEKPGLRVVREQSRLARWLVSTLTDAELAALLEVADQDNADNASPARRRERAAGPSDGPRRSDRRAA